ncbi:hypothetical protein PQX77_009870 [Marasmius sp. AFHP31]|nr:hypothetical protein PQX77_009870 [Marasmius sp. AFHP31]
MVEDFCREALIWTHLDHPNVLPLIGVNTKLFGTDFCLVSPWMENGDIITFLKRKPDHDRMRSIKEIAAGLEYLHSRSPMIVHGDIRGGQGTYTYEERCQANILVDEGFNCRLADFGLSREALTGTTTFESSTGGMKGSLRWMAPEGYLLSTSNNSKGNHSPRDIYAYACTIIEILTGKPPFSDLFDGAVIANVLFNHARPPRPTESWCPDCIWKLVERCWIQDSRKRPTARYIHSYLKGRVSMIPDIPGDGPLDVAGSRAKDAHLGAGSPAWCYPRARWRTTHGKKPRCTVDGTEADLFCSVPILRSVDFAFHPRFFI